MTWKLIGLSLLGCYILWIAYCIFDWMRQIVTYKGDQDGRNE